MSSIGNVSAASHQIPAATTGKAQSAKKQEGQAALNSAESTTHATQATTSSGPKATGNIVDTTV